MGVSQPIGRIDTRDILEQHLDYLMGLDPRLQPLRTVAGEVPLRRQKGGFAGLSQIVNGQLLSVASARAIHGRFTDLLGCVTAARFLELTEPEARAVGLSGAKYLTLKGIAEAELSAQLDYAALGDLPVAEAMAHLMALKGIGHWTAEIYLLFCVGHPDIFPAGDLALRKMVGYVLDQTDLPDEGLVREVAETWSPVRGAAARLLWQCFAINKSKEGIAI